jgi:hypothetical protein
VSILTVLWGVRSMSNWYTTHVTGSKGTTVWTDTSFGAVLVADCTSESLNLSAQRRNARLCSVAPTLMELLEYAYLNLEPEHQVRFQEIAAYVYES